MISYAEARAQVLGGCRPLTAERLPLARAVGRVLAEPIVAPGDVPAFPNSAMDGYAVRASDLTGASADRPQALRVIGTLGAGEQPAVAVGPGEALRIMTGAPWPQGADAVAIVEVTRAEGDRVLIFEEVRPGLHVRPAGDDIAAGSVLFHPGEVLGPAHLGVLASVGCRELSVIPAPVVAILSTGNELVPIEDPTELRRGQIRDSNRVVLTALLEQEGYEVLPLPPVGDDVDALSRVIDGAIGVADALISTGGVSMGVYDHVRRVLGELGEVAWMQVAIRPAKPLAFGLVRGKPVFGLPGNPVSSLVSYELFARPGLRRLAGHADARLDRPRVLAVADAAFERRPDGRVAYLRGVAAYGPDGRVHVRPAAAQGSHQLWATSAANALVVCPDGPRVEAGAEVEVLLLAGI
jgi:molybdopterin molybdotransferase